MPLLKDQNTPNHFIDDALHFVTALKIIFHSKTYKGLHSGTITLKGMTENPWGIWGDCQVKSLQGSFFGAIMSLILISHAIVLLNSIISIPVFHIASWNVQCLLHKQTNCHLHIYQKIVFISRLKNTCISIWPIVLYCNPFNMQNWHMCANCKKGLSIKWYILFTESTKTSLNQWK